jgi:hypothetical protein
MKQFKKYWVLAIVLLSIKMQAAEQFLKTKTLSYAGAYTLGMYVDLSNQYGDIEIIPFSGDSVKIVAKIEVNSKKEENLQSTLDNITVDFKAGNGYLIAETHWTKDVDFFTKSYYAVKTGVISNDDNIVVNYQVFLPTKTELNIKNKFGNVYVENHTGRLTVDVFHGDFRARDLKDLKSLDLKFGKLKINSLENAEIKLSSVKFAEINTANSLIIKSVSSEIEINTIETLVIESKHDEIEIQTCGELNGTFSLTDLKVNNLKNRAKIDAKLGSLRLLNVSNSVQRIDVNSYRSDCSIGFSETTAASIELLLEDKKYLYLGTAIEPISETPSVDNQLKIKLQKGKEPNTVINIKATKAFIEIGK